ncbi:MAG: hypothetical protein ACRDNF_04180 [Streptosporangiaceae bacterium]
MSSAILYLAIVAIWAGVLIPRWLKRDTSQTAKSSTEFVGGPAADAHHTAHTNGADREMAESDADTRLVAADNGERADRRDDDAREYEPSRERRTVEAAYPDPAENRARILSARRRMLLILCALTVAALGIAMIQLAAWWVAVPPILMLGGYLMLLREASRADAERGLLQEAALRDEQERQAAREAEAGRRAEEAEREAGRAEEARRAAAAAAETARIFDISGRVRDELYDQYADTERRAVGD